MKRILALFAVTLSLAGCSSQTLTYDAAFSTRDAERQTNLTQGVKNVIEGRLLSQGKKPGKISVLPKENGLTVTVEVPDEEAAMLLTQGLTAPFTMEIMKQVSEGQGDIISDKFGEFKETGIRTEHFDWVTAITAESEEENVSMGAAKIDFTPAGQKLLQDMFSKNRGSVIGIFVRGQLMSKKVIDMTDTQAAIAIDGIPRADLATAFADDVNVGLHVKFTEVK